MLLRCYEYFCSKNNSVEQNFKRELKKIPGIYGTKVPLPRSQQPSSGPRLEINKFLKLTACFYKNRYDIIIDIYVAILKSIFLIGVFSKILWKHSHFPHVFYTPYPSHLP